MNSLNWLALAIVALVASFILGSSIALGVSCALFAAFLFGVMTSAPMVASLSAHRVEGDSMVEVGNRVTMRVGVKAGGAFALRWLLVKDRLPDGAVADAPTGSFTIGGAGFESEFYYGVRMNRRGVHRFGPITANYGDILGLRSTQSEVGEHAEVIVHPKTLPMPEFGLASTRPLGDRHADPRSYEDPTRPAGSRPYAHGDPLRRIHWPATARTGTLVSKVYDGSSAPLHVVVLNRCSGDYSDPERFEIACTAAASIVALLARSDQEVGLHTGQMLDPDSGELHLERCLAALARVESTSLPFDEQLLRCRMEVPWRSTLIVVTERLDEMSAAGLEMMRRGGATVAALVIGDPIETQGAIGRVAAIGGSVARIEKEGDIERARFIGFAG